MAWKFAVGERLTAGSLNAVTRPNNAIAVANRTTNQTVSHNTATTVTLSDVDDPLGWHAAGVFTPTIAGRYRLFWEVRWDAPGATANYSRLFHNVVAPGADGGRVDLRHATVAGTNQAISGASRLILRNGTTDTVRLDVLHINTGAASVAILSAELSLQLVYPT